MQKVTIATLSSDRSNAEPLLEKIQCEGYLKHSCSLLKTYLSVILHYVPSSDIMC